MIATFTKKEFYEEIVRFREFFGNKEWWKKSVEQRDACVRGLSHMYFNLADVSKEEFENVAMTFDATITEYQRRASMLGLMT